MVALIRPRESDRDRDCVHAYVHHHLSLFHERGHDYVRDGDV